MLPQAHKLTSSRDFSTVFRQGKRAGRSTVVCHFWHPCLSTVPVDPNYGSPKVGLVVGKGVGNSVTRHRLSRVIRHVVRPYLETLPAGSWLVVRALPPAGTANHQEVVSDITTALGAVLRKMPDAFPIERL